MKRVEPSPRSPSRLPRGVVVGPSLLDTSSLPVGNAHIHYRCLRAALASIRMARRSAVAKVRPPSSRRRHGPHAICGYIRDVSWARPTRAPRSKRVDSRLTALPRVGLGNVGIQHVTGVAHRRWLDPQRCSYQAVASPRRQAVEEAAAISSCAMRNEFAWRQRARDASAIVVELVPS